jgi:quinol monooxygenase YgiN
MEGRQAMIVVTGSVLTNTGNRAAIETEGVAHCRRSRAEPGCIAHNAHTDCENPDRLVFVEKWSDAAALLTHFAVPESGAFVRAISALSTEPPSMEIYDADEMKPADLRA